MATVATKPYVTMSSLILTDQTDEQTLIDMARIDGIVLDFQTEWDALISDPSTLFAALDAAPTEIRSDNILWGDTTDGLRLTGTGLGPVSSLDALAEALQSGLANGDFDTLEIYADGSTIGTLTFSTTGMTLVSGTQSIAINGVLPTGVQDLFDLIQVSVMLADPSVATDTQLDDAIALLNNYDLNSISFNDGSGDLFELTLGETALQLALGGALLEINGTFPTGSLGEFLGFLREAESLGSSLVSLSQLSGVAITGATLTDASGRVVAEITGSIDDIDPVSFSSVFIEGTDGDDLEVWAPYFREEEADEIRVDLGAGTDSLFLDGDSMQWSPLAPMVVENVETVALWDYSSTSIDVDLTTGIIQGWGWNSVVTPGYEVTLTDTPDLAFSINGSFDVLGDGTANTVEILGLDPYTQSFFNGAGGLDTIDVHDVEFFFVSDTGISYDEALNGQLSFSYSGGSDLYMTLPMGWGDAIVNLTNVETIALAVRNSATEDRTEMALADLVADVTPGLLLGTGDDDLIQGDDNSDTLLGQDGDDVLLGDGFQSAYDLETSASVYRLYQATLDRAPDTGGHKDWTFRILNEGISIEQAALGFVASAEFQATYGNLTSTEFVELLYQNVLGRAADANGLSTWVGQLDGGASRAFVVRGFSQSGEFISNTRADAYAYANASDPANWSDDVFRIYQATLARNPDLGGFLDWTARLSTGATLEQAATGFVNSTEFQNTYGNLTNTEFVELLYRNVLGRAADANGLTNWVGQLDGGTARASVVKGFAQSGEFITQTDPELNDWMRNVIGTDDVIVGGEGNNVLAGGMMSDVFVFEASSLVGSSDNTVFDLEAWDTIQLSGFGYITGSEARADFTLAADGASVLYSKNGVDIEFMNASLDLLDAVEILV